MDPYLGEIRLFAGLFAPVDWEFCNGQLLPIQENQALYSLLGTQFGGDGKNTFAVPNLQMRLAGGMSSGIPPGMANSYPFASNSGQFQVALSPANMPAHNHALNATTAAASSTTPGTGVMYATAPTGYTNYLSVGGTPTLAKMNAAAFTTEGGGGAHANMMPTLSISYIICKVGLYPDTN